MTLSNTSVFFDFDGTISTTDIGVHILDRLADPSWRQLEDLYADGTIGSRECMEKQWACIPESVDAATRIAAAAEVPLDAGFGALVDGLRAAGAEVTVVSDGYGFYIGELLAQWNVPIFTNQLDLATNTLSYPHANPSCASCAQCGTCKPSIIEKAARRSRTTVFVGDGMSDRYAARSADVLFATAGLARWCDEQGIAFTHFDQLSDVAAVLLH